jgi:hypothetical protein
MGDDSRNPLDLGISGIPMLTAPPPARPQPGESIGPETFATWIPAPQALRVLTEHFGTLTAIEALIRRLANGHLIAAAESATWSEDGKSDQRDYTAISHLIWQQFIPNYQDSFWKIGDAEILLADGRGKYHTAWSPQVLFMDVRFDPAGFQKLMPRLVDLPDAAPQAAVPPAPSAVAMPAKNKGGRPPKAYWEDCLIHFFGLIYSGDLKPANQAALEDEMAAWISANHNDHPSEAIIRTRAAKLWNACQD